MRRTALLLASMILAVLLASGVALAMTIQCEPFVRWCEGTNDHDTMYGTIYKDRMNGLDGNDTLLGDARDDLMIGGAGNDTLKGGDGYDSGMAGGAGNDTLKGGLRSEAFIWGNDGQDKLFGQSGNDGLIGGPGDDELNGGSGDDSYPKYSLGNWNHDTLTDASGIDEVFFADGWTSADLTINLGAQATPNVKNAQRTSTIDWDGEVIENATGGGGNDTIKGNNVANVLDGGWGDDPGGGIDTISARGGNDEIYATEEDMVDCGDGDDTLIHDSRRVPQNVNCETVTPFRL